MRQVFCYLILMIPFIAFTQNASNSLVATDEEEINWMEGLSWKQVKEKAKSENKYIFIDAFTTWCGPCKSMDKKVYSNDTVVKFINANFLSVKVQMDKTSKDEEGVKSWYKDAEIINKKYKVDAYPSLIFLSPSGEISHMAKGYKEVPEFIQEAQLALVPGKVYNDIYAEYDSLIKDYKKGIKHYEKFPYMFSCAAKLGEQDLARELAKDHSKYVFTLPKEKRYTQDNIKMWKTINLGTRTRIFKYFYTDGKFIDSIMKTKGYADEVVEKTINLELIQPFFKKYHKDTSVIMGGLYKPDNGSLKPSYEKANWRELKKSITKEVNKYYADKSVLWAKIEWYQTHRLYNESGKLGLEYLGKYFIFETGNKGVLNNYAFTAFQYSTDKKVIDGYISLLEKLMQVQDVYPGFLDTYANLLYKAGRKQEAIQWELKAAEHAVGNFSYAKDRYEKIAEQMKRGEPTWGAIWGYK